MGIGIFIWFWHLFCLSGTLRTRKSDTVLFIVFFCWQCELRSNLKLVFLLLRILVMSKGEYSTNLISSALSSWVMCFFKDTLLIVAPPVALWEICICAFIYILFGTVQYLLLRKSFSKIIYTYIFGNEIYHPAREEMFISPWEVHFGYFELFCLGNSLKVQVCVYHLSREPWFYFFYFFLFMFDRLWPFPFFYREVD